MSLKKTFKKEKLEERILSIINAYLRKDVYDQRIKMITVTGVSLNPDFSHAKVFWDCFDYTKRNGAEEALDSFAPKVRYHLSKILSIRQVPELKFMYDNQYEAEHNIMSILQAEKEKFVE